MRIRLHLRACNVESKWIQRGGIILRTLHLVASLALATSVLSWASAQPQTGATPQWEIYGSCSAAYLANWQLRRSTRDRDMSSMIQEQAEDFKTKAIGFYESELKVPSSEARRIVDAYVTSNVERFIAMEKAGTLEAYIDQCPAN